MTSAQFLDAWYYSPYKEHARDYSWCDYPFGGLSKKAQYRIMDFFDPEDGCGYRIGCNDICYQCFLKIYGEESEGFLLNPLFNYLPGIRSDCYLCMAQGLNEIAQPHYAGYFHYTINGESPFLMRQLEFTKKYPYFEAYWPETSPKAENINEVACQLFEDLIKSTALSQIKEKSELQKDFPFRSWHFGFRGSYIRLACTCFRFSDFYHVAKLLEQYSESKFSWEESYKIKLKLASILSQLAPLFVDIYAESISLEPTEEIIDEIQFMFYYFQAEEDLGDFNKSKHKLIKSLNAGFDITEAKESAFDEMPVPQLSVANQTDWLAADFHFLNGIFLNDALIYGEAIKAFTESIRLNPSHRESYIERAMAYFETNQIKLALNDYESAKKLTFTPPFKAEFSYCLMAPTPLYIPESRTEFADGLVLGIVEGGAVACIEFIPSTFSCCRGVLNGLWAFVCSPAEVTQDMTNATYAVGRFIYEHKAEECLQCVVPELKDLASSWDQINDRARGKKIGYIIGKYGIDIFLPIGIIKGAKRIRELKMANTMCTLESCAASQAKQAKILEESAKRAILREGMIAESINQGKILVKNSNAITHIMQPKHAWDKVLKLSGNAEADFKKLLVLLEDSNILDASCLKGKPQLFPKQAPKISKSEYEKIINNCKVHVELETYLETGEFFLQDAWVITK
jgi:tetratricopeptide (TPR) repeat protein